MTHEYDELIDATIDKMEQAGSFDEPERTIKQTMLHGFSVKLLRRVNNGTMFIRAEVDRQSYSGDGFADHTYKDAAGFWSPALSGETEQQTIERASAWAARRALCLSIANAVDLAMTTEPDLIADAKDTEPWVALAEQCIDLHVSPDDNPVKEGTYTIDVTAIMDSPEVGPNMGGVWDVPVSGDLAHADTSIPVRCELTLCFNAGGRWLAVYDVELETP